MKDTWASGALELLRHADSHIDLQSAFDKRMAFISIDNCVESAVRSFLSLPIGKSGIKVSRDALDGAANSFPKLIDLLFAHAPKHVAGLDAADIEHYHRIRNKLYHEGTGLSVDDQYLHAYRAIAVVLLERLFGVKHERVESLPPRLDSLILNWNKIDRLLRARMHDAGIDVGHTYKWEAAVKAGILSSDAIPPLAELRMARNRLVHSENLDPVEIAHWVRQSEQLLTRLQSPNDPRTGG